MSNPVELRPFEVVDFSGGMTDNPFSSDYTKYQKANNLFIKENLKLQTRSGSGIKYPDVPHLPDNVIGRTILSLNGDLLYQNGRNLFFKNTSSFDPVLGVGDFANPVYSNGNEPSYASWTEWNNHLFTVNSEGSKPVRVYKDAANWKVHKLGLPKYVGTPVFGGPANSGGDKAHSYAFHLETEYEVNGVSFMERGAVVFFNEHYVYGEIYSGNVVTINPSFDFVGNSTDLYDKTKIKLAIYRNTNAGNVWYRVGALNAGHLTPFTDDVPDADLILNDILYIDGGVLQHDQPPECKIVHQVNDIAYYGVVKEGAFYRKNKMRFSNRFMPWSCPSSFEEEFDDDIIGIGSVGSYPVVLCKNSIYRVEGFYDQTGAGTVRKKRISDKTGCISARSIVITEDGLFFAGSNGFYFTDGNSVNRISNDLNETYKKFIKSGKSENICGTIDLINHHIYFAVTSIEGYQENNEIFVGHIRLAKGTQIPFTYFDGGLDQVGFTPVSLAFDGSNLIRSTRFGYIFEHSKDLNYDLLVDYLLPVDDWIRIPIIYSLQTLAINFGTDSIRKWAPYLTLVADNLTDLHLDIFSSNDNVGESYEKSLKTISQKSRFLWGDPTLLWGDPVNLNIYPVITAKRYFPKGGVRCFYRQLRFTNGNKMQLAATDETKCSISGNQITFVDPLNEWPLDLFNLEISFEHDDYKERFKVISNDGITLEVQNDLLTLPQGEFAWKLYAYDIGNVLSLISYQIFYGVISPTHQAFRTEP